MSCENLARPLKDRGAAFGWIALLRKYPRDCMVRRLSVLGMRALKNEFNKSGSPERFAALVLTSGWSEGGVEAGGGKVNTLLTSGWSEDGVEAGGGKVNTLIGAGIGNR